MLRSVTEISNATEFLIAVIAMPRLSPEHPLPNHEWMDLMLLRNVYTHWFEGEGILSVNRVATISCG